MKTTLLLLSACLVAAMLPAAQKTETKVQPAERSQITLEDFKLVGDLGGGQASIVLTATAKVEGNGGSLELVSGNVALTELGAHPKWSIRAEPSRFVVDFDKGGKI